MTRLNERASSIRRLAFLFSPTHFQLLEEGERTKLQRKLVHGESLSENGALHNYCSVLKSIAKKERERRAEEAVGEKKQTDQRCLKIC